MPVSLVVKLKDLGTGRVTSITSVFGGSGPEMTVLFINPRPMFSVRILKCISLCNMPKDGYDRGVTIMIGLEMALNKRK